MKEAPWARGRFLRRKEQMRGMNTQVQSQVQEIIRRENLLELVAPCWQGTVRCSGLPPTPWPPLTPSKIPSALYNTCVPRLVQGGRQALSTTEATVPTTESGATKWMNLGVPPCNRAFLTFPPPALLHFALAMQASLPSTPLPQASEYAVLSFRNFPPQISVWLTPPSFDVSP